MKHELRERRMARTLAALAGTLAGGAAAVGQYQFDPPIHRTVGSTPVGIAAADLDGLGGADLAVIDQAGRLDVLLNDGAGGIAAQRTFTVFGNSPPILAADIAAGEVTEEGDIDLLVADEAGPIVVLQNQGAATGFLENTDDFVAPGSKSVVFERFNAAGQKVIVGVNSTTDTVASRIGDGNGGYQGVDTEQPLGNAPCAIAVGSVDSLVDGHLDLLIANRNSASVDALRYIRDIPNVPDIGAPGGIETALTQRVTTGPDPVDLAVADFNGDALLDFAVITGDFNQLEIYFGDGLGSFSAGPTANVSTGVASITAGDFDDDGDADVAIGAFDAIVIASVGAAGISFDLTIPVADGIDDIITLDFDGDGVDDLAGVSLIGGFAQVHRAAPPSCEPDLDGSGSVDVFDLLAYLGLWFAGDPGAERTGDDPAVIDVFDLLAYLDDWFAGC